MRTTIVFVIFRSKSNFTYNIALMYFGGGKHYTFGILWYLTTHSTLPDLVFYLTASKSPFFRFNFMAEVHNEVMRILILHSANVNIAVKYFLL